MRAYLSSRAERIAVRARGFALVGEGGLSHRAVAEAERILAETEPEPMLVWPARNVWAVAYDAREPWSIPCRAGETPETVALDCARDALAAFVKG